MSSRLILVPSLALALIFGLACLVLELESTTSPQGDAHRASRPARVVPRAEDAAAEPASRVPAVTDAGGSRLGNGSAKGQAGPGPDAQLRGLGSLSDEDRSYFAGLLSAELAALERRLDLEVPRDAEEYLVQAERMVEAARVRGMTQELESGRYTLVPAGEGLSHARDARDSRGAKATILVQPARRGLEVVDAVFVLEHDEHGELRDAIEYRERLAHERLLAAHEEFNRLPIEERERLAGLAKRPTELASASREDRALIRRCFADGARLGRNHVLHVDW
ncbi:MAG: hypothetical protein IT457_02185 [Planctomycetes bacterium]|nr:hypothetical protein [Planctomycetota bacterium]